MASGDSCASGVRTAVEGMPCRVRAGEGWLGTEGAVPSASKYRLKEEAGWKARDRQGSLHTEAESVEQPAAAGRPSTWVAHVLAASWTPAKLPLPCLEECLCGTSKATLKKVPPQKKGACSKSAWVEPQRQPNTEGNGFGSKAKFLQLKQPCADLASSTMREHGRECRLA
eukprot:1155616-Pelagomonas_calceolata.AAC.7